MSILTKIRNRTRWLLSYPTHWYYKTFYPKPIVKNIEETLHKIIDDKVSISRYGDGELNLMAGRDIPFQVCDPLLTEKLRAVIKTEEVNFIVGLTDIYESLDKYSEAAKCYFENHIRATRKEWYRFLKFGKTYYSAQITRPYMDWKDKSKSAWYFQLLKQIWANRKVLIVEGEKSRLGVGNDLFDGCARIERILCPAENAFLHYNEILKEVTKADQSTLILLALGPTATALSYDIYKLGYQSLDIGHVDIEYEWYLMGATKKIAINNKYTNEAANGKNVGDSDDMNYLSQIVARIE